jgi:hypothetical protein
MVEEPEPTTQQQTEPKENKQQVVEWLGLLRT